MNKETNTEKKKEPKEELCVKADKRNQVALLEKMHAMLSTHPPISAYTSI